MNVSWWAIGLITLVVAVVAGVFILLPTSGPLPREGDTVATRASCEAGCRNTYGGSGSAGFDACIRACGEGGVLREECPSDRPACPAGESVVCRRGVWYCRGESAREGAGAETKQMDKSSPALSPASAAPAPIPTPAPPPPAPTPPPPAPEPPPPAPPPPAPKTVNVSIRDFAFSPASVTLNAGDTIVFTNFDAVGHTATKLGAFDSGIMTEGQSKPVVFAQKGTFDYHCDPHPYMRGTVVVE